jgi:hypothetical protein
MYRCTRHVFQRSNMAFSQSVSRCMARSNENEDTFKRFRNSWFNLLVKTDPLSLNMVVGNDVCEKCLLTRHKPSVLSLVSKAKRMGIASGYLL